MKRIFIIFSILILGIRAYGAFDSIGGTARSKAFGEAMFGEMDGVNSVGYNPATISLLRDIQIYGAWDTPFSGFDDGSGVNAINFDVVIPFWNGFSAEPYITRRAAFGISVHRNSLVLDDGITSSEIYHEGIYSFTYAKDLNDVISRGAKISAGVRFNIFDIGYSSHQDLGVNPLLAGADLQKLGFGLDVGITYDFSESIRLGLSMKNLISPNLSIFESGTNTLVSEMRFGANWDIGKLLFMKDTRLGFGIVSYGREANDNRAADMSYNLGYQFGFLSAQDLKTKPFKGELFTFRMGAIYQSKKIQADVINLTAGLGFMYILKQKHKFNIDYAVEYGINSDILQHTAGMTYSILLPRSAFVYDKSEYNEVVKQEIEQGQTYEPKEYEAQFPTNFAKYDIALAKADAIKKEMYRLSLEVSNFAPTISVLIDPGTTVITNVEEALKDFKQKMWAKGARLRVKVTIGSTVTYRLIVSGSTKQEGVKQAVQDFEKILDELPNTLLYLRDTASSAEPLGQELNTLRQSAPKDFVKGDKRYLKKAKNELKIAGFELEAVPENVSKLVPQYQAILDTIADVFEK